MKWGVWNISRDCWQSHESWGRKGRAKSARELLIEQDGHLSESLEVRMVPPLLEAHGTKLMVLKPDMIWRAALDDVARRQYNMDAPLGYSRFYSFHRKHVIKANSANDVLRAAIADPEPGRQSAKTMTRLLYSDVELLKAALK